MQTTITTGKPYDYARAAQMPEGFKFKLTAVELKSLVDLLNEKYEAETLDGHLTQVRTDLLCYLETFHSKAAQI